MIGNLLAIWILYCLFAQYLNVLYPYHAPYEYKKDMATLKADYLQKYEYFPDSIPKEASGVKWMCCPSMMQGMGYEKLFFYAEETYLQEICNTYEDKATIYTYSEYAWMNNKMKKTISFPGDHDIDKEEREHVEVFILYDNQDAKHSHNGGFYINQTEGYIGFFAQ